MNKLSIHHCCVILFIQSVASVCASRASAMNNPCRKTEERVSVETVKYTSHAFLFAAHRSRAFSFCVFSYYIDMAEG